MATTPSSTSSGASLTAKSLTELALALDCHIEGTRDLKVSKLVHPKMIEGPQDLAVIIDPEAVQLLHLHQGKMKAAVVAQGIEIPKGLLEGYLVVPRPRLALAILLNIFHVPPYHTQGIHPTAIIHESALLHNSVCVGPYTTIGPETLVSEGTVIMGHVTIGANVKIGKNCWIYSGSRIADGCLLGNSVVLQHNVSLGGDGFSYVTPGQSTMESAKANGGRIQTQNTQLIKIPSIGNVILEDEVEVGANTTIDRANLGPTHIMQGTKIDNLVMIGHNNTIGKNCLIVSQSGVSGSCVIGNGVVLAGQSGLKDHTKVGNDAIVMAKTGVMRDVGEKEIVAGTPAKPQREFFKDLAAVGKVSDLRRELAALKSRVAQLEATLPPNEHAN